MNRFGSQQYTLTPQPLSLEANSHYLQPPQTAVSAEAANDELDQGQRSRRASSASYKSDLAHGVNKIIANERAENIQHMRELVQVMLETGPPPSPPQRPVSSGRKRSFSVRSRKTKVNKSFGSLFGGSRTEKPEKIEKPLAGEGVLYAAKVTSRGATHYQILPQTPDLRQAEPPLRRPEDQIRRGVKIEEPLQLNSDDKETFVSKKAAESVPRQSYASHYTHLQGSDGSRPSTSETPISLTAEALGWSGAAFERLSNGDRNQNHRTPERRPSQITTSTQATTRGSSSQLRNYALAQGSQPGSAAHSMYSAGAQTINHRRGQSTKSDAESYEVVRSRPSEIPRRRSSRSATGPQHAAIMQIIGTNPSQPPLRSREEVSEESHGYEASGPANQSQARDSQASANTFPLDESQNAPRTPTLTAPVSQVAPGVGPTSPSIESLRQSSNSASSGRYSPGPAPTRALPDIPSQPRDEKRSSTAMMRPESRTWSRKGQPSPVERLALSRSDSAQSESMDEFMNMSAQEAKAKRDRRRQHVNAIKSKHTMSSRARVENKRLILADVTAKAKTPAGRAMIEASPIVPDSATIPLIHARVRQNSTERHIRTPSDQERGIEQVRRARAASQTELMEARNVIQKAKRTSRRMSKSNDQIRPGSSARPGSSTAGSFMLRPRTPKPSSKNNAISPIIFVFDQPPASPLPHKLDTSLSPDTYSRRYRHTPSGRLIRDFTIDTARPATAAVTEQLSERSYATVGRYHEPTPPRSPSNYGGAPSSEDDEMRKRMSDTLLNFHHQPSHSVPQAKRDLSDRPVTAIRNDGRPPECHTSGRRGSGIILTMTLNEFEERVTAVVDQRLSSILKDLLVNLPPDYTEPTHTHHSRPPRHHHSAATLRYHDHRKAEGDVPALRKTRTADGSRSEITIQAKIRSQSMDLGGGNGCVGARGGDSPRIGIKQGGIGYTGVGVTIEGLLAGLDSARRGSGISSLNGGQL